MPSKRQRERAGDPGLKPTLRVLLFLARFYHLMFPPHPQTATPAGAQTSKDKAVVLFHVRSYVDSWGLWASLLTVWSSDKWHWPHQGQVESSLHQGWHQYLHLKQNPKRIMCTSSLTSTAVVAHIRPVPTSSGVWTLGPLLMALFGGNYETFRCCILAEQRRPLGTGLQTSILPVHSQYFTEVKVWSLNFML